MRSFLCCDYPPSCNPPFAQVTRRLCTNRTAPFAILLRTPLQDTLRIYAKQRLNKTASIHLHLLWPLPGNLLPLPIHMQDGHITTEPTPPAVCLRAPPVQLASAPYNHAPWLLLAAAALAGTVCGVALTHSARRIALVNAATPTNTRQVGVPCV